MLPFDARDPSFIRFSSTIQEVTIDHWFMIIRNDSAKEFFSSSFFVAIYLFVWPLFPFHVSVLWLEVIIIPTWRVVNFKAIKHCLWQESHNGRYYIKINRLEGYEWCRYDSFLPHNMSYILGVSIKWYVKYMCPHLMDRYKLLASLVIACMLENSEINN